MPADVTPTQVTEWTLESLYLHFSVLLDARLALQLERDRRYEERFDAQQVAISAAFEAHARQTEQAFIAQEKAIAAAFASSEKAIRAAMEAQQEAINKAETASEKRFDCVSADTPILCSDLTWRPAGDLLVGDELIACDESGDGMSRRGRRFRRSLVTANSLTRDALLLVTTPVGSVRCNHRHPWLARHAHSKPGMWRWVRAEDLRPGDEVHHPVDVWENDRSWESGWLAGMYDGEGCLSMGKGRVQLSLSQRESPTSDDIARVLKDRLGHAPLSYRLEPGTPSTPNNTMPFFHFLVTARPEIMMLLGSTRPPRLLAKADEVWEGKVIGGYQRATTVTSIEDAGTGVIANLSTSTRTYIAGGFAMHNSVNEFRGSLSDQAARLMPRIEAEARFNAAEARLIEYGKTIDARLVDLTKTIDGRFSDMAKAIEARAVAAEARTVERAKGVDARLDEHSKYIERTQGAHTGKNDAWGYLLAFVGLIATVGAIVGTVAAFRGGR